MEWGGGTEKDNWYYMKSSYHKKVTGASRIRSLNIMDSEMIQIMDKNRPIGQNGRKLYPVTISELNPIFKLQIAASKNH